MQALLYPGVCNGYYAADDYSARSFRAVISACARFGSLSDGGVLAKETGDRLVSLISSDRERDLVSAAQQGDAEAFECLFDEYYERIYRIAYRWCGNPNDAEDITQQACIKLAKSLSTFRYDSAFSSWLYRLVINCAKDWYKTQNRHVGEDLAEVLVGDGKTEVSESHVLLMQVMKMLDVMAEGFKETALLVFAEGCSHREVAEILGVKESTISWRIHEIRKQLAANMQGLTL